MEQLLINLTIDEIKSYGLTPEEIAVLIDLRRKLRNRINHRRHYAKRKDLIVAGTARAIKPKTTSAALAALALRSQAASVGPAIQPQAASVGLDALAAVAAMAAQEIQPQAASASLDAPAIQPQAASAAPAIQPQAAYTVRVVSVDERAAIVAMVFMSGR